MATEERWQIASDADLIKRGRILTFLGLVILCVGSLVTVALMSVTETQAVRQTAGPIRINAPQVVSQTSGGSPPSTNPEAGGEQSPPATSNLDPQLKPASGTNVLGLPLRGSAPPAPPPPPSSNEVFEL